MKKIVILSIIGIVLLLLFACTNNPTTAPQFTATNPPATKTTQQETIPPTITPQAITVVPPEPLPLDTSEFPLSARGPFEFGTRSFGFDDPSRGDRHLSITVWYPAVRPENSSSNNPANNVPTDLREAPYPVILTSTKSGRLFGPHLVSHGFVVVGINGMKPSNWWGEWLIDYPLDLVFVLDQIAHQPLEGLEGMIDTNLAGAIDYSFGGYDSLALSGARVDPEYYLSQCANATTMKPPPAEWWIRYICEVSFKWDDFTAHAGESITASQDGLWQPITDERIRAVMPMAPEGAWLFGERGLAAVDRPVLILSATQDDLNYYDLEARYIFEHLEPPDAFMISFIGEDHMMIYSEEQIIKMKHFAVAFLGCYLQGHTEYAEYFSEDFVNQHEDLAWGSFKGE